MFAQERPSSAEPGSHRGESHKKVTPQTFSTPTSDQGLLGCQPRAGVLHQAALASLQTLDLRQQLMQPHCSVTEATKQMLGGNGGLEPWSPQLRALSSKPATILLSEG